MNMFRVLWWWSDITYIGQEPVDRTGMFVTSEEQLRTELMHLHQDMQDMGFKAYVTGREPHGCDCGEWEQHSFLLVDDLGTMVHDVLIRELVLAPGMTLEDLK